jgi:hypothetical protein
MMSFPMTFGSRVRAGVLKIDKAILVLIGIVVVFSALGLNQSSVGMYGESTKTHFFEAPPRPIRSDEWYVRLPWVVSRERNGFSNELTSVGIHDPWITYDLPVNSPQIILKPHLSPYLFLDINRAVAAEWWVLVFGSAIGAYVFMKALGIRKQIALPVALILMASPGLHWWNVNSSFISIFYGGIGGAAFLTSLRSHSSRSRLLWGLLSGWMFSCATVILYPPFQLATLGTLGLVLLVNCWDEIRAGKLRPLLSTLLGAVGGFVLLVGWFILDHRTGLSAMANTVYPGTRRSTSGGENILSVLGATYDLKYSGLLDGSTNYTNPSENSSTFYLVLPMLFLLGSSGRLREPARIRHTIYALVAWFTCLMAWMLLSLPTRFGELTFLSRVPPGRMKPAIAFTAMVLAALLIHYRLHENTRARRFLAWSVFSFITLWIGSRVVLNDVPISMRDVWLFGALWLIPLAVAMTRFTTVGLWLLTATALITVARINPVNRSIDPLVKNSLARAVTQIDPDRKGTWMTFSGVAQVRGVIVATGVKSIASVSPYPDPEFWRKFDPTEQYRNDWNRYAHIQMVSSVGPTTMKLTQGDVIEVTLDPCATDFPFPKGTYFVEISPSLVPCTTVVKKLKYLNIELFVLQKV